MVFRRLHWRFCSGYSGFLLLLEKSKRPRGQIHVDGDAAGDGEHPTKPVSTGRKQPFATRNGVILFMLFKHLEPKKRGKKPKLRKTAYFVGFLTRGRIRAFFYEHPGGPECQDRCADVDECLEHSQAVLRHNQYPFKVQTTSVLRCPTSFETGLTCRHADTKFSDAELAGLFITFRLYSAQLPRRDRPWLRRNQVSQRICRIVAADPVLVRVHL
jgi:hypothetical protein